MKVINWWWIGMAALILIAGFIVVFNGEGEFHHMEGLMLICTGLLLAALASLIRIPTEDKQPPVVLIPKPRVDNTKQRPSGRG